MKKTKKQLAIAMASCLMVGALAFGGTMAYLTDTEGATNTFTVGKVQIDLEEPGYPGNTSNDVKNLVPNQEVAKDPQVENTGINDAIVFMTVEVPRGNVTAVAADGTKGTKQNQDLFWFKDTADAQGTFVNKWDADWIELTAKETHEDTDTTSKYIFAYKTKLAKDAKTTPLFDKIQLKNVIEGEIAAGEAKNIVVNAYAIQAAEVLEGESTDLTDTLTDETLGKIYDVYFKQNGNAAANTVQKDAATNNAKDLSGTAR